MAHQFPLAAQPELNYLYALDGRGIKLGLERVAQALSRLGNPQDRYPTIHIAGTNGKGSTCAMLAAALQHVGWRVGLYTSPHLLRFNERIRIDGRAIDDEYIRNFVLLYRPLIEELNLTFFEATTALAMHYFAEQQVDWAIFETGLGGRLDATNLLKPQVTVITPIGRDHEEFLGKKLAEIAFEKAGIAKAGVPCVIARQTPVLQNTLLGQVAARGALSSYAPASCRVKCLALYPHYQQVGFQLGNGWQGELNLPLIGDHQLVNLQTVLVTLAQLQPSLPAWQLAVAGIAQTNWQGRLQVIHTQPLVFFDAGHNVHGLRAVVRTMQRLFPDRCIDVLLAMGRAKYYRPLGRLLAPLAGRVYLTELEGYPSVPCTELYQTFARYIPAQNLIVAPEVSQLLPRVMDNLPRDAILLILGSHYLAPVAFPYFQINV